MAEDYIYDVGGVATDAEIRHALQDAARKGHSSVLLTGMTVDPWAEYDRRVDELSGDEARAALKREARLRGEAHADRMQKDPDRA